MPEITAITPQKKDKTRCNIEVDGHFYCGMKLETVMINRLKAGSIVAHDELSRMQLESEKQTALDKALQHISASMKTEREVRDFLKRKGYLQDVSDFVVERMREYGYLDDSEYARLYTSSAAKRKGARVIEMELRRKGVSDEAIEEVVGGITDGEETARKLLEKYLRGKTVDKTTLRKAYAHLIAKGFDYDTARAALAALGEPDED